MPMPIPSPSRVKAHPLPIQHKRLVHFVPDSLHGHGLSLRQDPCKDSSPFFFSRVKKAKTASLRTGVKLMIATLGLVVGHVLPSVLDHLLPGTSRVSAMTMAYPSVTATPRHTHQGRPRKVAFSIPKGRLLHPERSPSPSRKVAFSIPKGRLNPP